MKDSVSIGRQPGCVPASESFVSDDDEAHWTVLRNLSKPLDRPRLGFVKDAGLLRDSYAGGERLAAVEGCRETHVIVNVVCTVSTVTPRHSHNPGFINGHGRQCGRMLESSARRKTIVIHEVWLG